MTKWCSIAWITPLMSFAESQTGSTETLGEGVRNLKLQMVKQEGEQDREAMEKELKDCQLLFFVPLKAFRGQGPQGST